MRRLQWKARSCWRKGQPNTARLFSQMALLRPSQPNTPLVLAEGPAVAEPAPAEDAEEDPPPAAAAARAWWPSQEDFEAMALYQRRRLAMSRLTNFVASLLRPLHDDDFKDLSRKDAKKEVSGAADMLLNNSP